MSAAWQSLFDVMPGYLDIATVGVPPRVEADAVQRALEDWRGGLLVPRDLDPDVTPA